MATYKQYENEHIIITDHLDNLKRTYAYLNDNKQLIREYPSRYKDEIEKARELIHNALLWARKLINRRGEQGGFNNKEIAKEVKKLCFSTSTLISHYFHPYELEERAIARKRDGRQALRDLMGPEAKEDLDFLFESLDNFHMFNDKYGELSTRARLNEDDQWLLEIQQLRGELAFIIKRCKVIYKKYHDIEEISNMVHRKIVYQCRQLDIRLARYVDPITDIL